MLYLLTSSSGNRSTKGSSSTFSVVDRHASYKVKIAWACAANSVSASLAIKRPVMLLRPIPAKALAPIVMR